MGHFEDKLFNRKRILPSARRAAHIQFKRMTSTFFWTNCQNCTSKKLVKIKMAFEWCITTKVELKCSYYGFTNLPVYLCPSLSLFPCPACPCLPPVASPGVSLCTSGAKSFQGGSPGRGSQAPWSPSAGVKLSMWGISLAANLIQILQKLTDLTPFHTCNATLKQQDVTCKLCVCDCN